MGNWTWQPLTPGLAKLVEVRAEVVNGDDEVLLDVLGGPTERVQLTGTQAMVLGQALYLAGSEATWARFKRERGDREGGA